MFYTLAQARKRLSATSFAYGATGEADIDNLINMAVQALASMSGWECLRKVLRFSSAGPGFVLPQGCAGLVRACVNGSPTTVRGQDFRFIQSGPGDFKRPPKGFHPVRPENIYDTGIYPVMVNPRGVFRLAAFSSSGNQPNLEVKGLDESGRSVRLHVTTYQDEIYNELGDKIGGYPREEVDYSEQVLSVVTEVTLHNNASDYVTLCAKDIVTLDIYPIAVYHPDIKVPSFRHYEIVGIPPCHPLEILAETRIDPLPLINDNDVIPFQSLEPIEWMIRADWQMKAGEVTSAQKYQDMAAKWLKSQEIIDDSIQTQVVINSVFDGSPGEVSMESFNI